MKIVLLAGLIAASIANLAFANPEHIKGNGNISRQTKNITPFNKIATGGSLDIEISQGNREEVTIETDENLQQYIIAEVKNNTLNIHVKDNINISSTKLKVKINCIKLESISAGGSGDIETSNQLKNDELTISQGGSGDFKLNLEVGKLKISKAGSGDFKIEGKADQFQLSSAGSGDVHAQQLAVKNAEISMVGSSDIWLAKGTKVKVSNVGSGDVHYE